nr:MAG TPA: hypothetical protein [Caudoviricetes sp.]
MFYSLQILIYRPATLFLRGNTRSVKTNVVLFEKYRGSLEKVPW